MGNATKLQRVSRAAALAVVGPAFVLLVSCDAAKPIATVPKGALSSQLNLGKSGNFSEQIATDDGDSVVTLGRNGQNNVVASTKKGRAYVVDIEKSTVTKISPLYPNRDEGVFSLTTSSKYGNSHPQRGRSVAIKPPRVAVRSTSVRCPFPIW